MLMLNSKLLDSSNCQLAAVSYLREAGFWGVLNYVDARIVDVEPNEMMLGLFRYIRRSFNDHRLRI